jgi:hypothetical protein
VKKLWFLLAAALAIFFAIPAVAAGPPGDPLALEASGPVASVYIPTEAAVASLAPAVNAFTARSEAVLPSIFVLVVVAVLAYLMRSVASSSGYANIARTIREREDRLGSARVPEWV